MNGGTSPGRDNPEAELAWRELRELVRPRIVAWERKKKRAATARRIAPIACFSLILLGIAWFASLSIGAPRAFGSVLGGTAIGFVVIGGIHWWERRR